jgi:DNA-binding response OmpR family regulator
VKGYDIGADLYLPKPVAEAELLSAVRAVGRQIRVDRERPSDRPEPTLTLDPLAKVLQGPEGRVGLNPAEVSLLSSLSLAPGQQLDHWQLIESMGMAMGEASVSNLAVRVTRLRGKLVQVGCPGSSLRALRAKGYQLGVTIRIL